MKLYCQYLLIAISLLYTLYKLIESVKFLKAVSNIPGPATFPILGNIQYLSLSQRTLFQRIHKHCIRYGPIFKIKYLGTAYVILMSPEDIEAVISGMKNMQKSDIYGTVKPWLRHGIITCTANEWQQKRKLLVPAFHFDILRDYFLTFVEFSNKFCKEIENLVDRRIDVLPIFSKYTMMTITETAMGANSEGEKALQYALNVQRLGHLSVYRLMRPWLHPDAIYHLSPLCYKTKLRARQLINYAKSIIQERKKFLIGENQLKPNDENENEYEGKKKRLSMIDTLLHAQAKGAKITDISMVEEVNQFVFAGHDTVSTCLSFTCLLLANHKQIQDKVLQEILEVFPDNEQPITYDELSKLRFLEQVIKESLRIFPSAPLIGRKTTEEILTPSGYHLPKGTNLIIRIFELHRDPKIYPDPLKFDPDRFLPENIKGRHPYSFMPFSAGPRNCIGQKFAMLQLKTFMTTILRKFEVIAVDTPDSMTLLCDLILRSKYGVNMKFIPRNARPTDAAC